MSVRRPRVIAAWILSFLLTFLFVFTGSGKVLGMEEMLKAFEHFGYPSWFRLFIGAAELAGAIGLLRLPLAQYAAAGLMIIMAGAVWTHIGVGEPVAFPVVVLIALAGVIWLRRGE
ncbi:MAG: DoxX family protein [Deltaproteobacteria bacterium]|nr:DoxX family protein [Deltaproteobacteria bacterium]